MKRLIETSRRQPKKIITIPRQIKSLPPTDQEEDNINPTDATEPLFTNLINFWFLWAAKITKVR